MRLLLALSLLSAPVLALAQDAPAPGESTASEASAPTAEELMSDIDDNLTYDSRTAKLKMVVVNPRRTREFSMQTYGRGKDHSAIEYLAPAREKGTRLLKQGDELWMYLPQVERTQKISGHMLREGMMGSDVSYEDMMSNTRLVEQYEASVTGTDTVEGRECWQLEMIAADDDVTYRLLVTCIDKEWRIPLRQELYALSGMLLKTWTMSEPERIDDRWVPMKMRIEDKLQEGTYTELLMEDVKLGVDLPGEVFSRRWLERG